MTKLYEPAIKLKDVILEEIGSEGKSISALFRELAGRGYRVHRLVLTGYLKALADCGILRERKVPPSILYFKSAYRERGIYSVVGDVCKRRIDGDDVRKATACCYILQAILNRPIFMEEIRRCGFYLPPVGRKLDSKERVEVRKAVKRSGLKLPHNDPAYVVSESYISNEELINLLVHIILEKFSIYRLSSYQRQTKLG